ncbi:MAG: hypothetical protein K2N90_04210 [Lachnospiraceae bacterium]|nr:hypothetical protein [Lachnospiraceae bacterium]
MIIRQGIDSKALLVTLIRTLPQLLLLSVAGAVFGSGLHCVITLYESGKAMFVAETEYYVDFADGRLEAKDYYNDFTWNDVIATDLILGRMMDELGADYDRAAVKQMINADILSDVRYLTITVKGMDADKVAAVSAAFKNAITQFGKSKDEFDAIDQIEDNGIEQEQPVWFVWRAAFLGMVVFLAIGIFMTVFAFMVGDRLYTKTDIIKFLELTAIGLSYRSGNGKSDVQERRMIEELKGLLERYHRVYLLDAADGQDAGLFLKRLVELDADVACDALLPCRQYKTGEDAVLLAIVPFGRVYREKITDEINNAVMHGATIAGAVLTECDKFWVGMYYGKDVRT